MYDIVRLTYSAYEANLKVLINNKPVPQYSPLVQFMNEPLYKWCEGIFDYIDGEIEGEYILEFIGRPEEFEIISFFGDRHPYCKKRIFKDYPANTTILQKRMSELSRIIKNAGLSIRQLILNTTFFVASSAEDMIPMIGKLDVANNFCRMESNVKRVSDSAFDVAVDDCNFLITRTPEFIRESTGRLCGSDYAFVLLIGKKEQLLNIDGNVYVYEAIADDFFSSIFKCLLLFPLADVFRQCCNKILKDFGQDKIYTSVSNLLITDCKVLVEMDDQIELGTTSPIKIKSIPPKEIKPVLSFSCMPEGIIECSQLMLKGMKEGSAEVYVFANGDSLPVLRKQIRVIKRNRIQTLLLSETLAYMGEGDQLKIDVSFSPEDADNYQCISWSSDNSTVATVSNGLVKARRCGHCRISCSAEKISSVCTVYIRPYATSIDISPEPNGETIAMEPNTSIQLHCSIVPENAIDAQLYYESSDPYIANVIQGEITARQEGEAKIFIYNSNNRIKRQLTVLVEPLVKEKKAANSILKRVGDYIKSMFGRS